MSTPRKIETQIKEPVVSREPEMAPSSEPKKFPRHNVDINALRRAINESLKKQVAGPDVPAAEPESKEGDGSEAVEK